MRSARRFALFGLLALAALATTAARADTGDAGTGQTVYEQACASCHEGGFGGFFTGAPKTGKAADWTTLLAKGEAALLASTLEGIGKMKPRGGCDSCSDEQIAAAIAYMIERSR
jgi:cytochrome c5